MPKPLMRMKKRVTFGPIHVATNYTTRRQPQTDRRNNCDGSDGSDRQQDEHDTRYLWYSSDELEQCREDSRITVELLHEIGGHYDAMDEQITCVRGLEKYADMLSRVMGQRRLVQSILIQQANNKTSGNKKGAEGLSAISRVLSQPSVQTAQFYAMRNFNLSKENDPITKAAVQQQRQKEVSSKRRFSDASCGSNDLPARSNKQVRYNQ